jgi:hypothetical protein
MTFNSYASFVEAVVLPRRKQNPAHRRLDGWTSGGNFAVAGIFRHDGREWKVHEDSHYEPLLLAYEALMKGEPEPFIEAPTKRGTCLDLKPELRAQISGRHKYFYVYSV